MKLLTHPRLHRSLLPDFAPRSHHALNSNYPSERSRAVPVSAVPAGRCNRCKGAPSPCRWCARLALECPGCLRVQCIGSHVDCREG